MSFVDFARAHGLLIGELHPSERIRRCPTELNPCKKNGAFFWDGQRGFVYAWDGAARALWYSDPDSRPWTAADQAAWRAKHRALDAKHQRRQASAALRAAEMIRASVPGPHNYLAIKGFASGKGLVTPDGALLVPMRSMLTNAVQGAQLIRWIEQERRYDKRMLPGMKAVLRLGNPAAETCLVEGYATGLSVHAAARSAGLALAVLVTFSDANLVHVAPLVKGRAYVNAIMTRRVRANALPGRPACRTA